MHRRQFLRTGAAMLGTLALSKSACLPAANIPARLAPEEFRKQIVGPILSVPTCYQPDASLDLTAIRRIVDLGIRNGSGVVTLTAGNNLYHQLSFDEIKSLTTSMIEAVAGRAAVIAATGAWSTEQAVEYAKFAHDRGAHALQVTLPKLDDDAMVKHFEAIAHATPAGIVLHGQPSVELMRRLLKIESIVAFKEEYTTIYSLPLVREFRDRVTFFAGGEKARLLTYWPYGMRAWYSTFMTFAPQVAKEFRGAVEAANLKAAGNVILKYETPVFARFSHPFWRATLEHFGLASRHVRKPETAFTDEQMAELGRFFDDLGLNR